jgi:hypothetical protein
MSDLDESGFPLENFGTEDFGFLVSAFLFCVVVWAMF